MKVSDAMTPEVQLCTPDDTLKDAAQAMAALGVGLLPVTDNDRLVGMISDRDIAIRGIGMGQGPEGRVADVMTAEVKYCYDDQDLDEVSANMGEIQVRRLPVLNRNKQLVGIIALGESRWCRVAMARARRCANFAARWAACPGLTCPSPLNDPVRNEQP